MACDCAFRAAERCLYEYPQNSAKLDNLQEVLAGLYDSSSMRGQAWEETQHNSEPGNPVAARALSIVDTEAQIGRLAGKVAPITRMMEVLETPFALEGTPVEHAGKFIRLWYFAKVPRDKVANTLGISRAAMFRLRERVVKLTIKYLDL